MKIKNRHINSLLWCLPALLALAMSLTSCINDYADCKETPQKEVSLNFKIISSNVSLTRADINGHTDTESDWPEFEDRIMEQTLAFFIFGEAVDGSWPILLRMTNLNEAQGTADPDVIVEAFPGFYDVKAKIESDRFQNIIGRSLRWGVGNSINLRVVAIANTNNLNIDAIDASTYNTFMNGVAAAAETGAKPGAKEITFSMSDVITGEVSGDHNVADCYEGAIPMFGLGAFTVYDDMLIDSNNVNYAMVGEVHLQRALAKICVIDNIANRDPLTNLPRIESVEMRSRTQKGYVLPYTPLDYESSDILNALYEAPSFSYPLGYLQATKPESPSGLVRFGYLPEQELSTTATGGAPAPAPYVVITVTFTEKADGSPEDQKTYYVPLSGYNGNSFSNKLGNNILRNHIYTLSVDWVRFDTDLDLKLEVKPWEEVEFNLDYTDQITASKQLDWSGYQNYDSDTGIVIVKPFNNIPTPVIANFGLSSPSGARWSVSLIPLEGETDAFYFVALNSNGTPRYDEHGNLVMISPSEAGGEINPDSPNCYIGIAPAYPEPDGKQRAQLQVYVTIGEGPSATVTQIDDLLISSSDYSNFIILQNP